MVTRLLNCLPDGIGNCNLKYEFILNLKLVLAKKKNAQEMLRYENTQSCIKMDILKEEREVGQTSPGIEL